MTSTLLKSAANHRLNAPTIHQLANGLTIVAEQMPVEAVNLDIWLNIGSIVESDAINGMAHFLEHMIFKGTARLQSGEFERRIEARGAVTNAATSQDYTHYYITAAPQDFADLAPLQIEVLLNARIPADGFEREQQVVLEEIRRSQDNPRRRTFQYATELAFDYLPYRRPVLGPAAVVANLTPQQMRSFHQHWYQPQRMTAIAVGNLPVDELIRIVADGFTAASGSSSHLANGAASTHADIPAFRPADLVPEPPFPTIVRREFVDDSLQQARLIMLWRVPGMVDLPQTYALDVLASVLGHGRTARLVQDLREQRGLVSAISASNMTYQHQGTFMITAHLPTENLAVVETAIVEHIRALQDGLVSVAEIERVRTRVANHFIFGNETPSDRTGIYGYYQSLVGDLAHALNYPATIQALSKTALQTAAQTYLSTTAYGVVTVKPGH